MRSNDSKLIKKNYLKKINLINKYNKAYYKNSEPIVDDFEYELKSGNLSNLGEILHENWMLKKDLSTKVSSLKINEIYNNAIKSGAQGGKILGAGGGGYFLFYVEEKHQKKVKKALSKLKHIKFNFENNGSKAYLL